MLKIVIREARRLVEKKGTYHYNGHPICESNVTHTVCYTVAGKYEG